MKTTRHGSDDARALHALFPPIDLHDDALMWARWARYDLAKRHSPPLPGSRWVGHVDLPRLLEGGVGAQFFGLVSLPLLRARGCAAAVHAQLDIFDRLCAKNPSLVRRATSANDAIVARTEGTIAAYLGIEGAHALEGKIGNVEAFARRGVRYLGLSHFSSNAACYPAAGRGKDPTRGLTDFGRQTVEACVANGVLVDLAHINRRGYMEAAEIVGSRAPLIVSHTGVLGAYEHWRNIDDEQLRAVADGGGVIGIIFVPGYLGGEGLDPIIRHMAHVIDVVGEDHVALGSDYDGMVRPPAELADIAMLPNLTDAMLKARWSIERIGKVLRTNVMRVLNAFPPKH